MTREMIISRASAKHTNGELRAAKRRLDWEKGASRLEGCVMAFRANGMRPRHALCHDTGLGDDKVEEVESGCM